jgi:MICOS complex subunit MIC60
LIQEEETRKQLERVQELAKAELAAAISKEKASQIERIAEANLNVGILLLSLFR